MDGWFKQRGFTIPEILSVVAIIGILGTVAIVGYQGYTARARASDIVLKYDALRSGAGATLAQGQIATAPRLQNAWAIRT